MSDDLPAAPEPTPNPIELALPVARRVLLQSILIAEGHFQRTVEASQALERITPDTKASRVACHGNREAGVIVAMIGCTLAAAEGDTDPVEHVSIVATFVATYTIDSFDGIEDANLDAFASTNGVFNVWPYWREFVQSASTRMGLAPILVPVFRIT